VVFFFFQAEDGIRDFHVTGVQTCALPIFAGVINIITKRGLEDNGWQLQISLQEETVGNEFEFFNEGRHIQNFSIVNQVNEKLSYSIVASRIVFAGSYHVFKGQNY